MSVILYSIRRKNNVLMDQDKLIGNKRNHYKITKVSFVDIFMQHNNKHRFIKCTELISDVSDQ